ncbi:hypothetical protein K431DRAFT_7332 [Polychaeton citri CBS 116435]|uniref:Uncharacterized protein n=1 Tax=Polychaeton citri CBS 116435 TaxID=1314669 RepID=A0A9P4UV41_9PEZI|nr:hypothetical protein K431DRAFT_7332 [Polychaeton citri CBS 116435]
MAVTKQQDGPGVYANQWSRDSYANTTRISTSQNAEGKEALPGLRLPPGVGTYPRLWTLRVWGTSFYVSILALLYAPTSWRSDSQVRRGATRDSSWFALSACLAGSTLGI